MAMSRKLAWKFKALYEFWAALFGLVIVSPLLLVIAMVIKAESPDEPVFFRQRRLGKDGKIFDIIKFRTMKSGSGVRLNPDGSTMVSKNDKRLTGVGSFLRHGLDELPQLINILKGEMGLVGPRADEPMHYKFYTEHEKKKMCVKPGITGLPQAYGRNNIPWKQRIVLDIEYINNFSPWLDLKIIFRTLFIVPFSGRRETDEK